MKQILLSLCLLIFVPMAQGQNSPLITSWLQNTIETGTYYMAGNSTALNNGILYNCQEVCYSANNVFITTSGVPAYPTGPFLDGNPSVATDQNAIFRFPLNPVQETGVPRSTTGGRIGVFINGVSLFDYRDGVAWNTNTGSLCGGPGNPSCPGGPGTSQAWNRDAIPAEMDGFDCSKAHPAMGNYHHHQNPSAFKWDIVVQSDICNLYDADGLYVIDETRHAPLIGFAYDGFPIYGAHGYKNNDGTGGITRIKSGYQLRNITVRTHHSDGTDVEDGPNVNNTYPLGYFREDYEWISHPGDEDYLDEHNGRFCVTPEYPAGIYAYFATVDADWNSAYPYVVGPTFYGEYANRLVNSINENCTVYEIVLPIELTAFSAILLNDGVLISWETASEKDNDFFTIERSSDGATFEEIAVIDGQGNTAEPTNYKYLDPYNWEGIVYYRLKQTDYNGASEYGKTVAVQNVVGELFNVEIFPNPSSDFVAVRYIGLNREIITISLLDLSGKLISTNYIEAGSSIGYLETTTLYNGQYILSIGDSNKSYSRKITVMH